jgi:para-aminobenzoate synthetase component 1
MTGGETTTEWLEIVPRQAPAAVSVETLAGPGIEDAAAVFPLIARRIAREDPSPFWLDSGLDVGGQGRFSFLGGAPAGVFRSRNGQNELGWQSRRAAWRGDPFAAVRRILARRPAAAPPGAPPFIGGAVGVFGYDLRYHVERLPHLGRDDLGLPDCVLGFYDTFLALDHAMGQILLCSSDPGGEVAQRYRKLVSRWGRDPSSLPSPRSGERESPYGLTANFTRPAYLEAVRRALDAIAAGDIYQVNLSQRFSTPYEGDSLALYERLRQQSPSPFAAYLDLGDAVVLSASPERFLRIVGCDVETRPIKGTRPRGATPEEDRRLAEELLASVKDRAELVMIVDLERNDLGRVCEYGSVQVPELVRLEAHPTVFHLVATVTGRLRPGLTPVDALRACFPGGSITGAPKIRAMEIIEELEPTHRGFYTGSIGYLGWDGRADLNIAIRTIVLTGDVAHFQVGGGIVADSDPAAEYEETLHKGRALMRALEGDITAPDFRRCTLSE